MNIHELKETDPKRFERKYWSWVGRECDYKWWDSVEENFKERMKEFGLDVYKIAFSLSYSQGDYAGDILSMEPDAVRLLASAGDHAAVLMLPAVIVKHNKE